MTIDELDQALTEAATGQSGIEELRLTTAMENVGKVVNEVIAIIVHDALPVFQKVAQQANR